jgi:hypothetical protein
MEFDQSIPVLFNGIIADQLNNNSAQKTAHNYDQCCATIIGLIMNPLRIANKKVSKVHLFYCLALQILKLKWVREHIDTLQANCQLHQHYSSYWLKL